MVLGGENRSTASILTAVPLGPQEIPHDKVWNQTMASAMSASRLSYENHAVWE
jgi:hypothetical protein